MKKLQRHPLSKKDVKRLIEAVRKLPKEVVLELETSNVVELVRIDKKTLLYVADGRPVLLLKDGVYVPLLNFLSESKVNIPKVVVDSGAVKHIVGGADVFRPGVVRWDAFKVGEIVCVVDEGRGLPLAIGVALVDHEDLATMEKGKVVKNVHHLGDKLWRLARTLSKKALN